MLRTRIIPTLLLLDESLVKTVRFSEFVYIGDPCNTVRIFNELEVDELVFLDIGAGKRRGRPNFTLLKDIANECFMPLGYGGGIESVDDAKRVFDIGFEKVALNTAALERPKLISEITGHYGSQAVIVSIDVKSHLGGKAVYSHGGKTRTAYDPLWWAQRCETLGAGEILLTSIEREGMWSGMDLDLIREVSRGISLPVIAHGGASSKEDVKAAVSAGASAVGLGSLVLFQRKGMGVLVNLPRELDPS